MGYTTLFEGRFDFDRQLTAEEHISLVLFSEERHGGNLQHDPQYPDFWCQWVPTQDDKGLCWDGGEKFYNYIEWLQIIIDNFLKPWGITMNGSVDWCGEDCFRDRGTIKVTNNIITIKHK